MNATTATIKVCVGNRSLFELLNIPIPKEAERTMRQYEEEGKTAILASLNGRVCGIFGIMDEIKMDAPASISYLINDLNIDVWMVTGDNARTAHAVAKELGLREDRVVAQALPSDKARHVRRLQSSDDDDGHHGGGGGKKTVCMVGDGINDSPALATADVGMSVGTGAAIAAEAADMVLVRGNVSDVCAALDLSRVVFRRIQINLLFSMMYNVLFIPIAMGVFYPATKQRLPPTIAAIAMILSSVSVIASSIHLTRYQPPNVHQQQLHNQHHCNRNNNNNNSSAMMTMNGTTTATTNDLNEPLLGTTSTTAIEIQKQKSLALV